MTVFICRLCLCFVVALQLQQALPVLGAPKTGSAGSPDVLVVYSFRSRVAPYQNFAGNFQPALVRDFGSPLEFDEISLDHDRFPDPQSQDALAEYIQKRFVSRPADLIVTVGAPAAQFVARYRTTVFAGKPVLFLAADSRFLDSEASRNNATLISQNTSPAQWIEDILQIAPDTKNFFILNGATAFEHNWTEIIRREINSRYKGLNFTFLEGTPLEQIEKQVAALPAHSFIICAMFARDSAGVSYDAYNFFQRLHAAANAPLYGVFQSMMGFGFIGGRLYQDQLIALEGALTATRILRGEAVSSIPAKIMPTPSPVYNWRELKRWGIQASRLPPGSKILFREPTFWELYRWRIVGVLSFIVMEALLIVALLINLRRRRHVEWALRQSEKLYQGIFAAEKDALLLLDRKTGRILDVNPAAEKMYGYSRQEFLQLINTDLSAEPEKTKQAIYEGVTFVPLRMHRRKDNKIFPVEISIGHLDEYGRGSAIVALRDISERLRAEELLRQSEERYRGLFQAESDAVFLLDYKTGQIFDVNPAAEKMYGYSRDEFLSLSANNISAEPEKSEQARLSGVAHVDLSWHRRKDGTIFPVEVSAGRLGHPGHSYAVVTMRDISLRFKSEELLRQSEGRYRGLFTAESDALFLLDGETGQIIDANPAAERMYGYTREELLKLRKIDISAEPESTRQSMAANESSYVSLRRHRRKDGTIFSVEVSTGLLKEADRKMFVAAIRDISQRLQAEEKLRQSENKYRTLFEIMTDAFVIVDMAGRIQEFNPAYQQMLGYSAEELRRLTYIDITPREWHEFERSIILNQVLERGYSDVYEKEYRRKDGTIFPVELRTYLIKNEAGEPHAMWAILRDISERKRAEEVLRQRNHYIDTVLEKAPIGFAVHTIDDGVVRFVSARFEEIYGVPRGTLDSRQTFFEKVWPRDPDLRERIRSRVSADMASGDASRAHWENVPVPTATGDTRYVTAMVIPLPEQNLMVSTVHDVTEQVRSQEALHRSEESLHIAAEAANFGAFSYESATNELFCTPEALALFGLPPGASIRMDGNNVPEVLHPEDKQQFFTTIMKAADPLGPGTFEMEYRVIRPDGQIAWLRSSGKVSLTADGRPGRANGITQDITKHKFAEEALERQRSVLASIMQTTDVMLVYLDRDFNFVSVNAAYAAACNMRPEEMVGKNHFAFYPDEENEAIFRRVRDTGEPVYYKDKPFEFPDQPERGVTYWDWSLVPVKQASGAVEGLVFTLRETTKYKQAELAIRAGEERFRDVAETTADFIWEIDADGLYTYTSPTVEKILGYAPDELVGKTHFYDLFAPHDRKDLKEAAFQVFATQQRFQAFPNANISKGGKIVYMETSGIPILDKSGRLLGYRGADTDVTERHRAEMERQVLRDELELVSRIGTLNELTASIAHEINQPLAAILSNAQSALNIMHASTPDLKEIHEILEDIVNDDQRAADVIRTLRSMLKGGAREHHSLSLNSLISEVLSMVHADALTRKVSIISDLHSSLPQIAGDRVQLQQVILNLIVNAFEAMETSEGTRELTLRTRPARGEIILDVIDSGCGIPPDKLTAIFEPFITTKKSGLGMGLSLSRTIAAAHYGRLWAENNPERGATFHLALPQNLFILDSEIEHLGQPLPRTRKSAENADSR